ncbi:AGE family epimerase/isomerase [Nocardioides currus]|uniref:N-acyl-D-glucosamine 2-epimerase n=1 Tax=Nocardioides currus TaxID=2133958 RepID=A0A2R7YY08_9ACTN|nr:AGE family epimerase/isomerase [Nocardioides currus]PUA81280.1 N-acyl-D-glucosamine 2-epimerase [Nocardioides currus]
MDAVRHRPDHQEWLRAERIRLLDFAKASVEPRGFGWLDERGRLTPHRAPELWITSRMTHSFALGTLDDVPGCEAPADHGIAALTGPLHDPVDGGWFASLADDPSGQVKAAYAHAFVVLAGASCVVAGRPGADALLDEALTVFTQRFWDDDAGMVVDEWDRGFTTLDPYRGLNANMHAVEALAAAADALDDDRLRAMALRIVTRAVHDLAPGHQGRIPEHLDTDWRPLLDYNRDAPRDQFRPFGSTIGHSFEWARLTVQLAASLGPDAPAWMVGDAVALFARALADGWAVDGADGFVYTVDWDGRPVVRERMHWVAAEAIGAAAALHEATGDDAYDGWYAAWWDYVVAHLRDPEGGSWWHELSPTNQPSATTWSGKPDVYHAVQATLIPLAPLAGSVAGGLARG